MKLKFALALGGGLIALAPVATAQTMNYGEMEELFGEPITTSATGSPQRRSEVPVTMDIVTAEDIRRSGATTIPEILSRLAGIDVYTWSKNSADVAIRGLNQGASNRLMVMVNGRENYTDGFGTLLWEFIPVRLEEIRQIEVIKGPNSALYGFNAAAGVINIITFNPEYDKVNAERLTVGTDGSQAATLVQTGQWAGGGVRASAGWTKDTESQFHPAFAGDRQAFTEPSINRSANFDAQTQVGDTSQLRLQEGVTDGRMRGMYLMPFYLESLVVMSQLDFSTQSELGLVDASLMNNHNQSQFRHSLASGKLDNDVTVAKLQDLFKIGAADSFRLATEYRRDDMPTYPVEGADLLSQTASVSGMWDHAFTKDLSLLNAARGDRFWLQRSGPFLAGTPYSNSDYDRAIYGWSFNSALVYRPTQLDSVKLSAARGLQLPSLTEYGIMNPLTVPFAPPYIPTAQLNSIGNPNLQTGRVMHYELSYDRQLPALGGSTRIAAYHQVVTEIRDMTAATLVSPPPSPVLMSSFNTVGGAHLNGIETEVKGRIERMWRWGANYSYEVVSNNTAVDQFHDYSRSTPRHKANATLGWDYGPWQADAYLRYVSRTEMPQQIAFGVYTLAPIEPVWSFSQRVSYDINPGLRLEAVASSGFADNPVSSEKHRVLFSVIARY